MDIPGYKIEGEIGRGGMATVYLAVQKLLRRQVALKIMDPALAADKSFTERFLKEGQIIAQLNHPQIITVYDIGCYNYYYYLCMEFVPGGTLDRRIGTGLSVAQALEIIKKISTALGYAHSQGVVHRDVKPQNILFRKNDTPVLTDFGIARLIDRNTRLTAPGMSVGSPRFMSPEQVMAETVDARSDLYSLGVIFYQMLTSRLPYAADDPTALALLHCTDPIPTLPADLQQFQPILEKLLAKRPEDRFQTAERFVQALNEALDATVLPADSGKDSLRHSTIPRSAPVIINERIEKDKIKDIIIKHRTGSKANQIQSFTLADYQELTLGREPSLNLAYDPDVDDRVGRKHATIQWNLKNNWFIIVDHNSRNGLFVNNRRVSQRTEIYHGDIIRLGAGGPEFIVEFYPPPTAMAPSTRQVAAETASSGRMLPSEKRYPDQKSAMLDSSAGNSNYSERPVSQSVITGSNFGDTGVRHKFIGRKTVEWIIYHSTNQSQKYLINLTAILFGMLTVLGSYFIYRNTVLHNAIADVHLQALSRNKMSAQEIMEKYGATTVRIELEWALLDDNTGDQIYHRYLNGKAVYIQTEKNMGPLLTTRPTGDDKAFTRKNIGSGVLIDAKGFILTTQQALMPWKYKVRMPPGVLYKDDRSKRGVYKEKDIDGIDYSLDDNNMIFYEEDCNKCRYFKWREVNRFTIRPLNNIKVFTYGSGLSLAAQITRIPADYNMALIKIDTSAKMTYVPVSPEIARTQVNPGDSITVLGYPAPLHDSTLITATIDMSMHESKPITARGPAVVVGVIEKRVQSDHVFPDTSKKAPYKPKQDWYELTVDQMVYSIQGAPVFNDQGHIIGLFYVRSVNDQADNFNNTSIDKQDSKTISYVIPIKYGLDLMQITSNTK